MMATFYGFFKKFDQIKYTIADTIVAVDINASEEWKYQGANGMPLNKYGKPVDTSIYFRITWALAGVELLKENPLGYGLLTLSFERLSKQKWENSLLSMTHSAWVDFGLGYGFIGIFLLISASIGAWLGGFKLSDPWKSAALWGFGFLNIVFLLKEISYEITVNAFIFLILFFAVLQIIEFDKNRQEELSKKIN
jgi:hypothetical protein